MCPQKTQKRLGEIENTLVGAKNRDFSSRQPLSSLRYALWLYLLTKHPSPTTHIAKSLNQKKKTIISTERCEFRRSRLELTRLTSSGRSGSGDTRDTIERQEREEGEERGEEAIEM